MAQRHWLVRLHFPRAHGVRQAGHLPVQSCQRYLPGHRPRTDYSDGDPDYEKPFYILKHTYCAAFLTENGFMDSEVSLSFLESEEGNKAIVALHVQGIINYVEGR